MWTKPTSNLKQETYQRTWTFYDDIVHALPNTIESCINSAIDRRSHVLEHIYQIQ